MTRPAGSGRTVTIEFRRTWGLQSLAEGMRRMRVLAEQASALKATEEALTALPERMLRQLIMITVRCPAGKLLLRVVRIPAYLPAAAYDTHLVIPTSATTYQYDDQRITAPGWFLAQHDETSGVRCRCHPEVTFTREQLRGESPPPPGVRVCANPGVRVLAS